MFNGQRIKDIIADKGMSQKEVFTKAGIKEATYYSLFKSDANPSSNILESIADVLECNIDDFFYRGVTITIGHHVHGNGNKISGDITLSEYQKEVEHLKELLAEKERTIQILMGQR